MHEGLTAAQAGPGRITSIAEWGRVFRDTSVWRPLVLAVLRRHGLAGSPGDLDIQPGEIAGTHAVFVVDRELVVKIYGPLWDGDSIRELAVLRWLGPRRMLAGDVALPRLIAEGILERCPAGPRGHDWPYAVTGYVPGTPIGAVWPGLSADDRRSLAAQLGQALAELHTMDLAGLGLPSPADGCGGAVGSTGGWRDSWHRLLRSRMVSCPERHRQWGTLPDHLLADAPRFLAAAGPLPRPGWRPALLSCDVTADHVLLAGQGAGWRVAGLIDFGDSMIGDPEYEFTVVFLSALGQDRGALDEFLLAYGHRVAWEEGFERRMMAYVLLHEFPLLRELDPQRRDRLWSASDLDAAADAVWGQSKVPSQGRSG